MNILPSFDRFLPSCRPAAAVLIFSSVFSALLFLAGCYPKKEEGGSAPRPVSVRTAKVETRDVQNFFLTTGRTDADPINIVPRVRGNIEEICFMPGDIVDEGAVLYRIEDFDYKNDVETARANLEINKANELKAKADYDRETSLQEKGQGFTTQADLDRTKALWDEAKAKVSAAEADLSQAQKELERTVIKAPTRGKINRTTIEKGNLVDGTAGTATVLTTIMPMDPIYVYFEITDSIFAQLYKQIIDTLKEALGDQFDQTAAYDNQQIDAILKEKGIQTVVRFEMGLPSDGAKSFPFSGFINYNDNLIDRNTGNITMRGEIANPDYMIYPGYICNVRIPGKIRKNAILVKQKALCFDLNEIYVWVLDEKGTPQKRLVTLGNQEGLDEQIIESGLDGSETYILDGTQNIRSGCAVEEAAPDEAKTDENGADNRAPTEKSPAADVGPTANAGPLPSGNAPLEPTQN